jgi:hypothetical protein
MEVMMDFETSLFLTIILFFGGTILTFSRRYNNDDPNAGLGVAGWTIFLIFCIWTKSCGIK